MASPRLDYVDTMRGLMILMVVYFHAICCVNTNTGWHYSLFAGILQYIRMPLFFLITGFFAYGVYDVHLFKKRFNNRFRKQFIPTVFFFFIVAWLRKSNLSDVIVDDIKLAYWFTYSLFQVWLLYAIIALCFSYSKIQKKHELLVIILLTIVLFPFKTILYSCFPDVFDTNISKILSLSKTLEFSPYFFVGVILKMIFDRLIFFCDASKLTSSGGKTLILILLCAFIYSTRLWHPFWHPLLNRVSELLGIMVTILIFSKTQSFWSSKNKIAQYLRYLGKNTLPIYLISGIIFLAFEKAHLLDWMADYINVFIIEFPVTIIIAIFISHCCLYVDSFIKRIKKVHQLIFG